MDINRRLNDDRLQMRQLLELVKNQSLDYLESLPDRSTCARAEAPPFENLSETGLGTAETMNLFLERFEPLMIASSGPRYLGFVTGGTTPASIAGDWLVSVYDQNTQSIAGNGDVSAIIELETIKLLLELLQLPDDFVGGFVTGATLSNFTCLAVARQWVGVQQNADIAVNGISTPVKVFSATPHSSSLKSLAMLGIGSGNIVLLKTTEGNREALDIDDLEQKLLQQNGEPCILISSGGTVNTVDFDDMQGIAALKRKYNFWWHVDAAFGGFAACSPSFHPLLKGWEHADSITVDCHKWLNVPYDSGVFFIRKSHRYLQVQTFQNSNAPYLGDPLENFSYLNFLPENSRRLRALPAWFSLRAYGKQGYQEIVEKSIANARLLGEKIETSSMFQLLAPVRLNTVCFSFAGEPNAVRLSAFLHELTRNGKLFMTPTVYKGNHGIRAAFVNWRTTADDVNLIWEEVLRAIP